jgi:hypothetical protein
MRPRCLVLALALLAFALGPAFAADKPAPDQRLVVVHDFEGMSYIVRTLAFRDDGALASGGLDSWLRIWDLDKGEPIGKYRLPRDG